MREGISPRSYMEAYEKVTEILSENLGCNSSCFTPETNLENLGIDPLDNIEIVMKLGEETGKELCPKEAPRSVGDLVKLLL